MNMFMLYEVISWILNDTQSHNIYVTSDEIFEFLFYYLWKSLGEVWNTIPKIAILEFINLTQLHTLIMNEVGAMIRQLHTEHSEWHQVSFSHPQPQKYYKFTSPVYHTYCYYGLVGRTTTTTPASQATNL